MQSKIAGIENRLTVSFDQEGEATENGMINRKPRNPEVADSHRSFRLHRLMAISIKTDPGNFDYVVESGAERLYQHHRVRRMATKAGRVMTGIFRAYMEDPYQMPPNVVARAGQVA